MTAASETDSALPPLATTAAPPSPLAMMAGGGKAPLHQRGTRVDFSRLSLALLRNAPGYREFTFAPKLNATTIKMLEEGSVRRSLSADARRRQASRDRIRAEASRELTFAPTLNPTTVKILAAKRAVGLGAPGAPASSPGPLETSTGTSAIPSSESSAPGSPAGSSKSVARFPPLVPPKSASVAMRRRRASVVKSPPETTGSSPAQVKANLSPHPPRPVGDAGRRRVQSSSGPRSLRRLSLATDASSDQNSSDSENDDAVAPAAASLKPGKDRAKRGRDSPAKAPAPVARSPYRPTPEQAAAAEKIRHVRDAVAAAVAAGKVFTIAGGYQPLRDALEARGWIERRMPPAGELARFGLQPAKLPSAIPGVFSPIPGKSGEKRGDGGDDDQDDDDGDGDDDDDGHDEPLPEQDPVWAKALTPVMPNLLWLVKRSQIDLGSINKSQFLNHFTKTGHLTTKSGLTMALRETRWVDDVDVHAFYPWCFDLRQPEDLAAFVDEFRLLAARNLVRHREEWSVPAAVLELALQAGEAHMSLHADNFLDDTGGGGRKTDGNNEGARAEDMAAAAALTDVEWEAVLQCSYTITAPVPFAPLPPPRRMLAAPRVVAEGATSGSSLIENSATPSRRRIFLYDEDAMKLAAEGGTLLEQLRAAPVKDTACFSARSQAVLDHYEKWDAQYGVAGSTNLWVIKPGAKSRGRGIFCENRLDYILQANSSGDDTEQYVAQKYLELPFLIRETKFDIRQWFLVTSFNPLTIWMYKHAYLRFSSQPFSLADIRSEKAKSVHLCNNAIQMHEEGYDSMEWAKGNQWTSDEFREYLDEKGRGSAWMDVIYPQMTQIIITACKANQPFVDSRRNSFELYGADFVLDQQLRPWLLEINMSPSMCRNTPTCAKLVPQVLEDVLKVVLDRPQDKDADVGSFEMVYRGPEVRMPLNTMARDLFVAPTPLKSKPAKT